MKKIKILYVINNMMRDSGVSTIIMNYYRNMNKEQFQIDFLLTKKYKKNYEEELLKNGSKIFYLKNRLLLKDSSKIVNLKNRLSLINFVNFNKEVKSFFENNKYDIVELHAPTFSFLFLKIAKKCNIPIRIVHSHSTIHSANKIKNLISIILNCNLEKYANRFFACSKISAQYWYGKKICNSDSFKLITNGVDIKKYEFNEEIRLELRKKYNIENKIVIGFVGRISKDKNLPFFIEVMKEVVKRDKKYMFLIIGDGQELNNIKILSNEIKNNVIFLGRRDDVNQQLNSMDLLVLPSKREGLPMVAIEAQLMKLPCYLSDTITNEVDIGNAKFIKLNKIDWVNEILNFKKEDKEINKEKFNINNCVNELEKIYVQYYKEIGENNDI